MGVKELVDVFRFGAVFGRTGKANLRPAQVCICCGGLEDGFGGLVYLNKVHNSR
jgi:hypothetical protein